MAQESQRRESAICNYVQRTGVVMPNMSSEIPSCTTFPALLYTHHHHPTPWTPVTAWANFLASICHLFNMSHSKVMTWRLLVHRGRSLPPTQLSCSGLLLVLPSLNLAGRVWPAADLQIRSPRDLQRLPYTGHFKGGKKYPTGSG